MTRPSSFNRQELERCTTGEVYGENNGKLPSDNMLMFDRITLITDQGGEYGKGEIRAELDVKPDLWFFGCHFKGDPVMPGCLGLDALWQLGGFFLVWLGLPGRGRALGAGEIKFFGQVLPTAKMVQYQLNIKRVIARKLTMVICDGTVSVDGKAIYQCNDLRIGLFTSMDALNGA